MSFSSGVKEELYRHISPARHCQLAELVGAHVYMTEGSYTNIKLTTPEDIALATLWIGGDAE